jgi:Mor family transcriptional regulator
MAMARTSDAVRQEMFRDYINGMNIQDLSKKYNMKPHEVQVRVHRMHRRA